MRSSIFVSKTSLTVMLSFALISAIFDSAPLCILFSFLFFFCLVSRLWGSNTLYGVKVSFNGDPISLFPGQSTKLNFTIKNDKLMPVIWLELVGLLDESAPLYPLDTADVKKLVGSQTIDEGIQAKEVEMLYKKFVFVMGNEEIVWQSNWIANHRGIYRPGQFRIRTGDGFGLTQCEDALVLPDEDMIAVFPAVCLVRTDIFLKDMQNAVGASKGFVEDITVIKSTRDYLTIDAAKRINWRITARTQKPVTNNYETILPKSVHFIIDGESFNGARVDPTAFEDSLSIIASVMIKLKDSGIRCGLSLPKGKENPPQSITAPDSTPLRKMLLALAGYDPDKFTIIKQDADGEPVIASAQFDIGAIRSIMNVGKYYYICRDIKSIRGHELLTKLEPSKVTLLPYEFKGGEKSASLYEFDTFELKKLKKEVSK